MEEYTAGRAERRARRRRRRQRVKKRLQKASQKTLGFAHRITHKGPIGKIHKAIQKMVPQPFKTFVTIGDASSKLIHKGLVKTGAIKASDLSDDERKALGKNALKTVTEDAAKVIRAEARAKVVKEASKGNPDAKLALEALEALDMTRERLAREAAKRAKPAVQAVAQAAAKRIKLPEGIFEVVKVG